MKAKSIKGKSTEEIKAALADSMAHDFKPTLAIVFLSYQQDREAIASLLNEDDIEIFGATTAGEFIDGEIDDGSIAILLLDIDKSFFKILLKDYSDKNIGSVSQNMAETAKKCFKNPAILLAHGVTIPGEFATSETIISNIEKITGPDIDIWGGVAGDDYRFEESFVFTNKSTENKGILMLVLDADKIILKGQAASGWKAVGTERTVTKSDKNWILEIDNMPASDVVLKFLGITLTKETAEKFTPGITVLHLMRKTGEPVMRSSGIFNWENKSIAVDGQVMVGDKIRLTLPPDFEMIETVTNAAEQINKNELSDADALIMFSCIGRKAEFGPMVSDEINGIRNAFNAPMAGFFCYGEFGRATNGNNEYHNMTCCWVALKEK
jgi:hypothetical protein